VSGAQRGGAEDGTARGEHEERDPEREAGGEGVVPPDGRGGEDAEHHQFETEDGEEGASDRANRGYVSNATAVG
jgi:hypothetical protein